MADAACSRRELFGGAIVGSLPARLVDVSDFRQVPDHQECFADGACDQSVMVELLDLQEEVKDADAAAFFFNDLAQANDATGMNIERIEPLAHDAMPHLDAGVVKSMCTGTQTVAKAKDDPSAVNCVHVLLANIRLRSVGTDVLITMNTPLTVSKDSRAAAANVQASAAVFAAAREDFVHLLRSLDIKDWRLFG